MSRIISIGTATPQYSAKQDNILEYMQGAYADETASRKLNALFRSSGIKTRYSSIPDFSGADPGLIFFNGNKPDVSARLDLFRQKAIPLAIEAISNATRKIGAAPMRFTHLITVTCTGIQSPGIDAILAKLLDMPEDCFHTSLNFLGCNAAFPSFRIADLIARTEADAKILVVCVELCTLHFQAKNNIDNLLSNTLFGDGAAAYIVVPDKTAAENNQQGLTINGFYSCLLDEGNSLMGWNVTSLNFEMILNAGVPDFIGDKIRELMIKAAEKLQILPQNIDKWAIHPGGRKILDLVKKELELNEEQMAYSYRILRDFGNMSSPTILFIMNDILSDSLTQGNTLFSVGFGPGISIDTTWFTYA